MNKFDLVKFTDNDFELDVRADSEHETVWLTQEEIAKLFDTARSSITYHINKIFSTEELDKNTSVEKFDGRVNYRPAKLYNLDVILSVGYRVQSKRGILFRRWANNVLKDYLVKGYAINQKRLDYLNKTIDIQNRMLSYALDIDKQELSKVINEYTRALDLLDSYDHQTLIKPKGHNSDYVMTYEEAREIIDSMKFKEKPGLFGIEKKQGQLDGIIKQVYQSVLAKNYIHQLKKRQRIYYIS